MNNPLEVILNRQVAGAVARTVRWGALGLTIVLPLACRPSPENAAPRLIVMIAVDQLGTELLQRYEPALTHGFRRLEEEGASFPRATVNHAITVSAPGHVTLSTGRDPRNHGIVDAAFYQLQEGRWLFTDSVSDDEESILGVPDSPGVSPRKVLSSGLAEWVLDADPDARIVAIGTGWVSSLLHARPPGDVYWFMNEAGRYVTSTYYRDSYPAWVDRFNLEVLPTLMDSTWSLEVPPDMRELARRDDASYESGGRHPTFPHSFHNEVEPDEIGSPVAYATWFTDTPLADAATFAFAKEAIRARQLGQRTTTDYVSITLSQIDDIGHWYGPASLEQLDNLLRLDRELGRFFEFLDRTVGEGRWVAVVSADHAAPYAPEHRRQHGEPAYRVTGEEVERVLAAVDESLRVTGGTGEERARAVESLVEASPFVSDVMTPAELLSSAPADSFIDLYRRSYRHDRVPRYPLFSFTTGQSSVAELSLAVRLQPDAMLDLDTVAHGSPYDYDRRVPLFFLGAGVAAGVYENPVHTTDVAPTLAALAGIPFPPDLDGRPLLVSESNGSGTPP